MAKKKESGNLGLIITLVFFVLSTVILGVTTYMGFSTQDQKEKELKEARDKERLEKNNADWRRFQSRYARAMMGQPEAGADPADLARELQQFSTGSLPSASGQKDLEDFKKFVQVTQSRLPWDPSKSTVPTATVESFARNKELEIEGLKNELKKARDAAAREKREREEAEAAAAKDLAAAKNAIEDLKRKSNEDRKKDLDDINAKMDALRKENEIAGDLRRKLDEAMKELEKLQKQDQKMKALVSETTKKNRQLSDELEEKRAQLSLVLEQTGREARAVESQVQDARAAQVFREWRNNWHIVEMDRRGSMPYINLGTADNLVPQVTFSIHALGTDGKLNPVAKGTAEVVKVIGPHLSQVRITSVRDSRRDPIMKGDQLFNATWDPSRKKHVAIAGLADLTGDGSDDTEELRRLLARQNVEVDAYIDAKGDKEPKEAGKGVTANTDYLILGDNLDNVNHPRAKDKDYLQRFERIVRNMKDQAASNGVTVISLKKYLELIGYRPPKAASSAQGGLERR